MSTILRSALISLSLIMLAAALPAHAQGMNNKPWSFTNTTSRASVAALMLQKEQMDKSSTSATVSGGGEAAVCGGGGSEATSTANYTCIIVGDGANAIIDTTQDNLGNQTSNTSTNVNDANTLSSALETLTQ